MDDKSIKIIFRIFEIELAICFLTYLLIVTSGIIGLAIIYLTPIIPLLFSIICLSYALKFEWNPIGWKALVSINVILSIIFVLYAWVNDPIDLSGWK